MENLFINASSDATFNFDLSNFVANNRLSANSPSTWALNELAKLGDLQARAISDILSSHRANFHVAADGTITITVEKVDTFIKFPKLPPEIRMKIWVEALPGPRIVEIRASRQNPHGRAWRKYCYECVTSVPTILHTNRESRQEGLKYFTATFKEQNDWVVLANQQPIYINFEMDTMYLAPSGDSSDKAQKVPPSWAWHSTN